MREKIGGGDINIFEKRHYVMYITIVDMGGDIIFVRHERPLPLRTIKTLQGVGLSSSKIPKMGCDVINDG